MPHPTSRNAYTVGVKPSVEFAYHLLGTAGEKFADVRLQSETYREDHGGFPYTASPLGARELQVIVRVARARYVLEVGGALGYTGLHIASEFGHTGRLDTVIPDTNAAGLASQNFERAGFAERVRIYTSEAAQVLPGLSGPYDVVILAGDPASYAGIYEDAVRLVRIGGTLLVYNLFELAWALDGESALPSAPEPLAAFVTRLAEDPRFVTHIPVSLERAVAARVR